MVKGFILAKAELLDHDTILLESSDKCINVIWWDSVSPTHPPPFDQMPGYLIKLWVQSLGLVLAQFSQSFFLQYVWVSHACCSLKHPSSPASGLDSRQLIWFESGGSLLGGYLMCWMGLRSTLP